VYLPSMSNVSQCAPPLYADPINQNWGHRISHAPHMNVRIARALLRQTSRSSGVQPTRAAAQARWANAPQGWR